MAAREWPLIVFTLLAQTGVGFFLAFTLPVVLAGDRPGARQALLRSLALVIAFLAGAAAFSLFHLGNPLNAWRTLGNLTDSWLSREIFFLLLSLGLLTALFLLEWARAGSGRLAAGIAITAALAGMALILSMSHIYRLEAVPSWDNIMTPFSFFATAAVLGALDAIAALSSGLLNIGAGGHPLAGGMAQAAGALVAVELVVVLLFDPNFGFLRAGEAAAGSPQGYRVLFLARIALLVVSGLCVVLIMRRGGAGVTGPAVWGPAVLALAAGLTSEGLGRFLFYALFRKAGL